MHTLPYSTIDRIKGCADLGSENGLGGGRSRGWEVREEAVAATLGDGEQEDPRET